MAHRVDASVNAVKKAASDPILDRTHAETQRDELRTSDDAMLAERELGDPPIDLVEFPSHFNGKSTSAVHGRDVGAQTRTRGASNASRATHRFPS